VKGIHIGERGEPALVRDWATSGRKTPLMVTHAPTQRGHPTITVHTTSAVSKSPPLGHKERRLIVAKSNGRTDGWTAIMTEARMTGCCCCCCRHAHARSTVMMSVELSSFYSSTNDGLTHVGRRRRLSCLSAAKPSTPTDRPTGRPAGHRP